MKITEFGELQQYLQTLKDRKQMFLTKQMNAEKASDAALAAEMEQRLRALEQLEEMAYLQNDSAFITGFQAEFGTLQVPPALYAGIGKNTAMNQVTALMQEQPALPAAKPVETAVAEEVEEKTEPAAPVIEDMLETKEEMLFPKPRTEEELNTIFTKILEVEKTPTAKLIGQLAGIVGAQSGYTSSSKIDVLIALENKLLNIPNKKEILDLLDKLVYNPITQEYNPVKTFYNLRRIFPGVKEQELIQGIQLGLFSELFFDYEKEEDVAENEMKEALARLFKEDNLKKAVNDKQTIQMVQLMDKEFLSPTMKVSDFIKEYWKTLNPKVEKVIIKEPVVEKTLPTPDKNNNPNRKVIPYNKKQQPKTVASNSIKSNNSLKSGIDAILNQGKGKK